jgi:serine protease SohB
MASSEDKASAQKDLNRIHTQFKEHIKKFRPKVDVDSVATGEVWMAADAMQKGLCDRLGTADEILQQMRKDGCDLFAGTYVVVDY